MPDHEPSGDPITRSHEMLEKLELTPAERVFALDQSSRLFAAIGKAWRKEVFEKGNRIRAVAMAGTLAAAMIEADDFSRKPPGSEIK